MTTRPLLALAVLASLSGCATLDAVTCPRPDAPLVIEQLQLPGPDIGVATLVHLPDGRILVYEVGSAVHAGRVREALGGPADFVFVSHPDHDHAGGLSALDDELAHAEEVATLGVRDLGGGVTLDTFLADGVLAVREGAPPYDVGTEHEELDLRDAVSAIDTSDNARSSAAVLRYGDFAWIFAGDLTGGGKLTPDVESAVAARGDAILVPGELDLLQLNHHGIRSSNNDAWLDWLLPDDGVERHALSAANATYLDAPHEDVLDAFAERADGFVWAGVTGHQTPKEHEALLRTGGSVFVGVQEDGSWSVCGVPVGE